MTSTGSRICTLLTEIQDAFLRTPDLTLSPTDAVRRFGTDRTTCEAVLDALVDARVLTQANDGAYESAFPQLHPHLQSRHAASPERRTA